MKICLISSTVLPCLPLTDPANGYNGLEQVVWSIASGLSRRGHDVLLVAPGGSKPPPGVTLHETTRGESEQAAYSGYWQRLPEFDVIIDHSWQKWSNILKVEGRLPQPILNVVHAPVNTMYASPPPALLPCIVAISKDQAAHVSELWGVPARVAYNGCFDGSTMLSLEDGSMERIDRFVARRGPERVAAWNDTERQIEFVQVTEWLELRPTNNFAIRLVTLSGRTLISTPDNEIMTEDGWKQAHSIVVGQKLKAMDTAGKSLRASDVRKDPGNRDRTEAATTAVIGMRDGRTARSETNQAAHEGVVDIARNETPQTHVADRTLQRHRQSNPAAHAISNQVAGKHDRTQAAALSSLLEDDRIKDGPPVGTGCGIPGRTARRGGTHHHIGEQSVAKYSEGNPPGSSHGDIKQLSEDRRLRQEAPTLTWLLAGGPSKQGTESISAPSDLSNHGDGVLDRGGAAGSGSIHDLEERTSGTRAPLCSESAAAPLHSKLQHAGIAVVHDDPRAEFSSWDEVVSVERVSTPLQVYDLCTPLRSFVANGIVVHNCDLDFYRQLPSVGHGDRYLFLARISKIKGPHLAMDLARSLRFKLDMVGDDLITGEPELAQRMMALAKDNIAYHGGVSRKRAVEFFSMAKALIHPAFAFREPFGLTLIEAQACGLPVIASDNGACRELISSGSTLTGFVAKDIDEMRHLIENDAVAQVKSGDCRENASRFSLDEMVKRYEALCTEAIDTGGW